MIYRQMVINNPSLGINKYNLIQMKPQRTTKTRRELSQGLPAIENNAFNQTIIINNPNFNINYVEHVEQMKPDSRQRVGNVGVNQNKKGQELPAYDPRNCSKGVDAWNLNKNLKEFSQTKQLGFFRLNQKVKSNSQLQHSPYLSHKAKPDIKSYTKIKSNATIQQNCFRQNKTIAAIKHQALMPNSETRDIRDRSMPSHYASTLDPSPQDQSKTTFRKRKFQSKVRNPRPLPSHHLEYLEPYLRDKNTLSETIPNDGSKTQRKIVNNPANLATRRNRFIQIDKPKSTNEKQANHHNNKQDQNQQQTISDMENSLIIEDHSPTRKTKTPNDPSTKPQKPKKRIYDKSIQKISKCFLSRIDNYFDQNKQQQLPLSKIQIYATTVHQPSGYSFNIDYKSSPLDFVNTDYDFAFEEEKGKTRPRTPYKRKKLYEEVG